MPDWLRNEFEDAGGDDGGRVLASARSQQQHAGRGVGHRLVHAIFFIRNTMKLRLDPVLQYVSYFLIVKMDKND